MTLTVEAIYENGVLRPLQPHRFATDPELDFPPPLEEP
jgi:hypothetical protein